jgi:hypothetical protein
MYTPIPTPTPIRSTRRATHDASVDPWLLWSIETPGEREVLSVAQMAECRCPDLCDRDHANE